MEHVISCDWLQFSAHGDIRNYLGSADIIEKPFSTAYFQHTYDLFENGDKLATISTMPKFRGVSEDLVIVKIANRILYQADLHDFVISLIDDLQLEQCKIARLDICADFVHFADKTTPPTFIQKVINNKIICKGKHKGAIHFEQQETINLQTFSLGRHTSDHMLRIYNKSRELKEVKDKPYIRERWKVLENKYNEDIWRCEIELHREGLNLNVSNTGERLSLDVIQSTLPTMWEKIFYGYLEEVYHFYYNANKSVKSRNIDWKMFNFEHSPIIPDFARAESITTIKHRNFAKMLANLDKEMRQYKEEDNLFVRSLLERYVEEHNLKEYFPYLKLRKEYPHHDE